MHAGVGVDLEQVGGGLLQEQIEHALHDLPAVGHGIEPLSGDEAGTMPAGQAGIAPILITVGRQNRRTAG
jgi:hypothetical protein